MIDDEPAVRVVVYGPTGANKSYIIAAIIDALESIGIGCEGIGKANEKEDDMLRMMNQIQTGNQPESLCNLLIGVESINTRIHLKKTPAELHTDVMSDLSILDPVMIAEDYFKE